MPTMTTIDYLGAAAALAIDDIAIFASICAGVTFLSTLLFGLTRARYFRRLTRDLAGSAIGSLVFGAAGLVCMSLSGNVRPVVGVIWRLPYPTVLLLFGAAFVLLFLSAILRPRDYVPDPADDHFHSYRRRRRY